jgi:hypothetical protein
LLFLSLTSIFLQVESGLSRLVLDLLFQSIPMLHEQAIETVEERGVSKNPYDYVEMVCRCLYLDGMF